MALSKHKREMYRRRIQNFWLDFSHHRIGFFGLLIIIAFLVIAIISPLLTPYEPATQLKRPPRVAAKYAAPSWFSVFPTYSGANPTNKITVDLSDTTLVDTEELVKVNLDELNFNFTSTLNERQVASVTLDLGTFEYKHSSPPSFTMYISYTYFFKRTGLKVYFIIKNHTTYSTWTNFKYPDKAEMLIGSYTPTTGGYEITNKTTNALNKDSYTNEVVTSLYKTSVLRAGAPPNPAPLIFPEPGVYGMQVRFEFFTVTPYEDAHAELYFTGAGLSIWGRIHGVLGANFLGNDVWTELVYGTRISLMVGVLSALAAVALGILYGVVSGYLGGFVDEFLMRVVDVLLCIPVLPILLVMTRYFEPNVYYIVVLIAIFGWQGLSRVIRSRVLSLKEMAFIESAKASGASDTYLITRHLVPNVLPIAMSAMVLAVPGAIITEASLSFLGFGDPNSATWGRMLYHAYQLGGLESWWIWLPPGLAICAICIGFVFMGHAIDEIVNPRLRRRR